MPRYFQAINLTITIDGLPIEPIRWDFVPSWRERRRQRRAHRRRMRALARRR